MATVPKSDPLWWDRDTDESGAPIRPDVRQAAHKIWPEACSRVQVALGDNSQAAEFLEASVSHISRHLNRKSVPLFSSDVASLLMLHFRQELRRRAGKTKRLQPVGMAADLEAHFPSAPQVADVDRRIDFARLRPHLSKRTRTIFWLRASDFEWKEVGAILGIAPSTARNSFWNNIRAAQAEVTRNKKAPGNIR